MILQLIRLNYRFLFNKITISILVILNAVTVLGFISSTNISLGYYYLDMYRLDFEVTYLNEMILIVKVVTVVIAIILTTTLSNGSANNLNKYLIDKPIQKYYVFTSKILTLFLVMVITIIILLIEYLVVLALLTPYTLDISAILNIGSNQIIQLAFYICLTNSLLTILPTILLSIAPLILFWYMEINAYVETINASKTLNKLYDLIPNLVMVENSFKMVGDYINYGIVIMLLILGNCLYFVKKDIN